MRGVIFGRGIIDGRRPRPRPISTLTVHRASEFTKRGRRIIASWLRKQADTIEHEPETLAKRYTARYLAVP
jgi:hypothetical protein